MVVIFTLLLEATELELAPVSSQGFLINMEVFSIGTTSPIMKKIKYQGHVQRHFPQFAWEASALSSGRTMANHTQVQGFSFLLLQRLKRHS